MHISNVEADCLPNNDRPDVSLLASLLASNLLETGLLGNSITQCNQYHTHGL